MSGLQLLGVGEVVKQLKKSGGNGNDIRSVGDGK